MFYTFHSILISVENCFLNKEFMSVKVVDFPTISYCISPNTAEVEVYSIIRNISVSNIDKV